MLSFLKKTKTKSSELAPNENKENCSLPVTSSSNTREKTLTNENLHLDITEHHSSDKSLLIYDLNESTARDLSIITHSPHKTCLTQTTATTTPSQIGRSDLNRILTSGYLNEKENMGYMKRGTGDHIASSSKSPQFHRPIGFSYNRTQTFTIPGTKKGMKALVTGQTKIRKVHCLTPQHLPMTTDQESLTEKEPIVLSRYSGGFIPDPEAPRKIESLDWPAPIALQAVPELLKTHRSRSESRSNPSDINDSSNQQIIIDESNENDELRHDIKLDKDIDEMSKIKDSSGMAHALLEDLRLQEKIVSKQLPLDPWKASRSPSAAIEPPRRCRFESPTFASPSRRAHTHSSSTTTNQDDSLTAYSTSITTTPAGRRLITLPRISILQQDHSLSPSPKAQTLPNRRDLQRSYDLDSTTNSSYSNDGDHNKSTHSAPILMTNLKIYPYEQLKVTFKPHLLSDIDRDHLERHLADSDFQTLFQMTRIEFYRLPEWRRIDIKKRLKLF